MPNTKGKPKVLKTSAAKSVRDKRVTKTKKEPASDTEEYEVEKVVDKKLKGTKIFYKIKWHGCGSSENSWEPLSNLSSCPGKIREYEASVAKMQASKKTPTKKQPVAKKAATGTKRKASGAVAGPSAAGPSGIQVKVAKTGYDEGKKAIGVFRATKIKGEIYLYVNFQGKKNAEKVPARIANAQSPQLVIDFYQSEYNYTEEA